MIWLEGSQQLQAAIRNIAAPFCEYGRAYAKGIRIVAVQTFARRGTWDGIGHEYETRAVTLVLGILVVWLTFSKTAFSLSSLAAFLPLLLQPASRFRVAPKTGHDEQVKSALVLI